MSRPIRDQVVVILGASSGIGRATALRFGAHGASVVVAARNEPALVEVAEEIVLRGGRAKVVRTDAASWREVDRLADAAVQRFGRLSTWVNVAGIAQYATVEQTTVEEIERIIQVDLLGHIYGMKAALPHLKRQGEGAIINVSSVLGLRSVPLLSAYCAAKQGIKGFADSLRLELEREKSGISVTTIFPSSINTPLFRHSRSKLGVSPKPMPPVYPPDVVAQSILAAAENPVRDIIVGGGGKALQILERISPSLVDRLMLFRSAAFELQQAELPADVNDNLFSPPDEPGEVAGGWTEHLRSSVYTRVFEHRPGRKAVALAAVALVAKRARRNGA